MNQTATQGATMSQWTVMQRTPTTRALASYFDATHAEFMLARLQREFPGDAFMIVRESVPAA